MTSASARPLLPLVRLLGSRDPWSVGVAIMLVLGLAGSVALLVAAQQGVGGDRLVRSAAQLWVNSAATGYVIAILLYDVRRLSADFARLRPFLKAPELCNEPNAFRSNRHPVMLAVATFGGAIYGTFFNYSTNGLIYQAIHGIAPAWEYAWGPVVLILLWMAVFHVLWVLFDNARLMARIARRHVDVRLTRLDLMDPFAHAGIRHLLMMIVGLTVLPIQAIMTGYMRPVDFGPALAIVLPVGLVLLVLPIFGAHRAIVAARDRELDRVDDMLGSATPDSERFMLLALYRHRIETTPAWPLSLRNLAQILLYLVLPPLAWVAAALVESLVSSAL